MRMRRFVLIVFVVMISAFFIAGNLYRSAGVDFFSPQWWDDAHTTKFFMQEIEKTYASEGLEKIEIALVSAEVQLIAEDRSDIRMVYRGYRDLEDTLQSKNLKLVETKRNWNFGTRQNGYFELYVPEQTKLNWDIENLAGQINIKNLRAEQLACRFTAGDLSFSKIDVENINCKATAGRIDIDDSAIYSGNIKTTAGEVSLDLIEGGEGLSITALAGDIELIIPEDSTLKVSAQAHAGKVVSEIPIFVEGSSNADIEIVAAAGSVKIKKR